MEAVTRKMLIGKCDRCGKADSVVLSDLPDFEGRFCQFCWRGVLAANLKVEGYAPNTPAFAWFFDNDSFLIARGAVRKKEEASPVGRDRRDFPPS